MTWLFSHSELIALSFLPNLSSCSLKDRYNTCGFTPGFSFPPGITNERGVGRGPQLPLQTSDKYRSTLNFCLYNSNAAEYCYCLLHCKRCKNCTSAWYFVGVQWNVWLIHKWMDEGIDGEELFLSQKWKDVVVASLLGASMLHGSLEQHAEDWGSRTHNLNLKTQHLLFFLSTGLPLFKAPKRAISLCSISAFLLRPPTLQWSDCYKMLSSACFACTIFQLNSNLLVMSLLKITVGAFQLYSRASERIS